MSEVLDRATGLTPFWHVDALSRHRTAPALVTDDEILSHADLATRVARQAQAWPGTGARRLVLLEIEPTVDAVVTYLAALAAGHVVLLGAPGRGDGLADAWSPDDRARSDGGGWDVVHGPETAAHDLHPDLGLLLSTSGSTGSPKLVRLSSEALRANAVDIAAVLGLGGDDRAVTTLPLHYCYGLSVLHAHLAVGASVLLSGSSVVDPDLWSSMRAHGVTSLAGVPHTFELLESSDAPTGSVPTLRQITQAGGRLHPARVTSWAERGEREGWDLRVMYGQTEATARMAVTAPGAAARQPSSVGMPVGRGRFRVCGPDGDLPAGQVGDLHYSGPNVMLGYALEHTDLARGRDLTELDTGDLARLDADGTLEIVGRRSSFLKVNGVRLDVEHVEQLLAAHGLTALVGGDDERLHALVVGDVHGVDIAALVDRSTSTLTRATGLPAHRVAVALVPALPRHPNGKLDRGAVAAPTVDRLAVTETERPHGAGVTALVALYAELLARPDTTEDSTFVDLGGDSLSYVELSLHLEERLGPLPAEWPLRPIRTLAVDEAPPRRRVARVDTTIVLRAAAILAIVGTHTQVVHLLGGAHILLGVAGFNFARFAASAPTARETWRRVGGTVARIAVPTFLWVAAVGLLAGTYSPANLVLANWFFGSDTWSSTWRLWFLEALVWTLLAFAALLSVPAVRRRYARTPFALVAGLAAVAALARLDVFHLTSPPGRGTAPAVLWLVAIGWAAQVATRRRQRLLLSAVVVGTLPGFMDDAVREATIAAGLLLVVWVRTVPVPRLLVPATSVLASASLYIYLTHFEVYRATTLPWVNLALSFGLGLAAWAGTTRLTARITAPRLQRRATTIPPVLEPTHRLAQEASR
jgi:hypothetical protein